MSSTYMVSNAFVNRESINSRLVTQELELSLSPASAANCGALMSRCLCPVDSGAAASLLSALS